MSDPTLSALLDSYVAALDTAQRSVRIARALAEGCRSSLHPPDDVVDAYLACVERDERQIETLVARVAHFRSTLVPRAPLESSGPAHRP